MPPSEQELLESGNYIRCACHNVIEKSRVYCPFCNKFNPQTSADKCPVCGRPFTGSKPVEGG